MSTKSIVLCWMKSPEGLTITSVPSVSTITINPEHSNYQKICQLCSEYGSSCTMEQYEELAKLSAGVIRVGHKYSNDRGDYIIVTKSDRLKFYHKASDTTHDLTIHDGLMSRFRYILHLGLNVDYFINFVGNLMDNPSDHCKNQLYRFLLSNNLPITADGCFLGYKYVRKNYMDVHSGTFDNSIGSLVEMDRDDVVDDPNQTCASGLHICSAEYLRAMNINNGDERVVMVKINPKHVVSIPYDYKNSKLRCCQYTVVDELPIVPDINKLLPEYYMDGEQVQVITNIGQKLIDWYGQSFNLVPLVNHPIVDVLSHFEAKLTTSPVEITDTQLSHFYQAFPFCLKDISMTDAVSYRVNQPTELLRILVSRAYYHRVA